MAIAAVLIAVALHVPAAAASPRVLVQANGGGGNSYGAHVFKGRFGLAPHGDACQVQTIDRPRRFGDPVVLQNGPTRLRLVLYDRRRPLRVVAKWWRAGGGPPRRLKAFRLRRYRGTAGAAVVGWTALVAIPRRGAGTVVFHVSWTDREDCLAGPDWLNAGLRIGRESLPAMRR